MRHACIFCTWDESHEEVKYSFFFSFSPGIHFANPKNMDQIERLDRAVAAVSKQLGSGASDGDISVILLLESILVNTVVCAEFWQETKCNH